MDGKAEKPVTPTGDAAENFLRSRKRPERKPSLLKREVLNLYKRGDEVRKTLQTAVTQGNPVLSDYATLDKAGMGFDYTEPYHYRILKDIQEGIVHLVYSIKDGKEFADPQQPRISLEGQELISIDFGLGFDTSTLDKGDLLGILLTAPNPEDLEEGRLTYGFYVSDQGKWQKTRVATNYKNTPYEKFEESLEMTPHDLELAGTALGILKNHINRVLNSSAPNT